MYVDEHNPPLTFNDLAQAVRRSAGLSGLGQDVGNSYTPAELAAAAQGTFNPNDPSYLAQSAASLPSGSVAPLPAAYNLFLQTGSTTGGSATPFTPPWWLLGVVVVGVFLIAGKK